MGSDPKLEIAGAVMKLFSPFANNYQHFPHRDQWEPGTGKRTVDTLLRLIFSYSYFD